MKYIEIDSKVAVDTLHSFYACEDVPLHRLVSCCHVVGESAPFRLAVDIHEADAVDMGLDFYDEYRGLLPGEYASQSDVRNAFNLLIELVPSASQE